eukprot:TRINITY_DN61185_c0_g1_i2.p1 TRINITY_DN61185_c0_g1~~TRINITY_DN61185_c0_g1_i2.p1  ORF type:complete len:121 (-),score=15.68 TRINITY_DN61185_c0_g1_i2:97-459(-)
MLDSVTTEETNLGEMKYVLATGSSSIRPPTFKRELAGKHGCYTLWFNEFYPAAVVWMLRFLELLVYRCVLGSRMAEKIGSCYAMYDHFLTYTFDFEPNLTLDLETYYPCLLYTSPSPRDS